MANGDSRFTFHDWADIPADRWGQLYRHPHHLNDGRGKTYTPHQSFVTAAFVVVEDVAYPVEDWRVHSPLLSGVSEPLTKQDV